MFVGSIATSLFLRCFIQSDPSDLVEVGTSRKTPFQLDFKLAQIT